MALRITIAFSDNPPSIRSRTAPSNRKASTWTLSPSNRELCFIAISSTTNSTHPRCQSPRLLARAPRRHEMGLIGAADILEPRTPLAQSLCQHGLGHRQPRGRPAASPRGARLGYYGGIVITDHANALGATSNAHLFSRLGRCRAERYRRRRSIPLGLAGMGRTLERAIRGSVGQGLLTRPLTPDDIYFRTILRT